MLNSFFKNKKNDHTPSATEIKRSELKGEIKYLENELSYLLAPKNYMNYIPGIAFSFPQTFPPPQYLVVESKYQINSSSINRIQDRIIELKRKLKELKENENISEGAAPKLLLF